MEPVGLDFINQRVGPWFPRLGARGGRAGPTGRLISCRSRPGPGTRQLQPAPLERPPAALLGVVIVPGG
jgi:hypothetical protein